jgi:large subunit ribosomal protein L32
VAVPKRRTSKARKRKRRTHDSLPVPNVAGSTSTRSGAARSRRFYCSNCNQPKVPHAVCPNCGYYRGKPLVDVDR